MFTAFALLAFLPSDSWGQSAVDVFDPNANGAVSRVAIQPDGKILVTGSFTSLAPNGGAPAARHGIARLNANGTLDTHEVTLPGPAGAFV